jgi:alpha-methylacyl-CoA racemase
MAGPLSGLRVLELQGRGPGPFGAMVLADLGAEVTRIERPDHQALPGDVGIDLVARGRRPVALDLKDPAGLAELLDLVGTADVLVEGNRPGVAERLGFGPDVCLARNPALIYARMTGWGQDGPYAQMPGHDINYVALSGALDLLGSPPKPPLNLLGDYGGGGMLLAVGVLAALFERSLSGKGQVVDAAMVDGVALLTTLFHGKRPAVLECKAPYYNVYETADGRWVSVGAGEPQFYAELLARIGLEDLTSRMADESTWDEDTERVAGVFRTKTLEEWCALLDGTNTCFSPVLTVEEAPDHPHLKARGTFMEVGGIVQPAPAPRFSRSTP